MQLLEKEECVREYLEQFSGGEGARSHQRCAGGDEDDTFVHIMSGINVEAGAESEVFSFADALRRANLSIETLAEGFIDRFAIA